MSTGLISQSLPLLQTEINFVQHVSQIALQFIVRNWHDVTISKVNENKLSVLLLSLLYMFSTLLPKCILANTFIGHSHITK